MWGRRPKSGEAKSAAAEPGEGPVSVLREALRQTRIELAEQSGVVVDLRDAELARLELLNDALDPLFADIPRTVDLFDRAISRGDTPRLWIDAVAHVVMGRDKRRYRFVQDTRHGRKVLAESGDSAEIARAVGHYVASRLIERERALAGDPRPLYPPPASRERRSGRPLLRVFLFGVILGFVALFAVLWVAAARLPH